MKAKSIKGQSPEEISMAVEAVLADGMTPTLAICFLSVSMDRKAVVDLLSNKAIQIFGCTTNGEFIDEQTGKQSAAILLLDIAPAYFKIFLEEYPEKNYREVATRVAMQAADVFRKPAFLLGTSHAAADGEDILHGFTDVFGNEVNVFGGAAGDDYRFAETFVFTNSKESHEGIVALVLDEEHVMVKGVATCGWKVVGTPKTVTKSDGNHVYTIDDMPAVDITARYGGLEDLTPGNANLLIELAANFPLQLQRENGEAVMRPGLVVDWNDRSFYTSGKVPEGAQVRFSLPPDWDVMDKVVKGVQQLKATKMPEADALVVFSCAGRILSFGPMMSDEIEGIRKVWNVPMAGMFSNAELGRTAGGGLEMHNLTTCTIALKEI